jgi:type I site-specific restriction endonuclease
LAIDISLWKTSENCNAIALKMTPEEKARQKIDVLLQLCGWEVQSTSEDENKSAGAET